MPKRSRSSHSKHSDDSDSVNASPNSVNTRLSRRQLSGTSSDKDRCCMLFERVKNFRDEDGETIFDMFWSAPSKRCSPEYYEAVKQPIDLATIHTRVRDDYYKTLDDLQKDIELLCTNVKVFYPADSDEYSIAENLMEIFLQEKDVILSMNITSTSGSGDESGSLKKRSRPRMSKPPATIDLTADHLSSESASETNDSNSQGSATNIKALTSFQTYFSLVAKHISDEGRPMSAIFTHLPSKKLYPDYYEIIHEPMDFRTIAERIQKGEYQTLQDIRRDFFQISKNAKIYNEPRSAVYEDAKELERFAKQKYNELEKKTPAQIIRVIPGAAQITESFAKAQPIDDGMKASNSDDDSETDENRKLEKGQDIRFPSADPRYPFRRVYDSVAKLHIAEPFMRLPSAKLYPDYYQEISSPISLLMIRNKINNSTYRNIGEFMKDMDLLFTNAQTYNRDDSEIYKFSVRLQSIAHAAGEEFRHLLSSTGDASFSPTEIDMKPGSSAPGLEDILSMMSSDTQCFTSEKDDSSSIHSRSDLSTPICDLARKLKPKTEEEQVYQRLQNLFNAVFQYQENGRQLNQMFLVLPSAADYPDYYDIISNPIDLTMIRDRMEKRKYKTAADMAKDLRQMFVNAKQYNEEGSQVYNDAVALEGVVRRRMRNLEVPRSRRKPSHGSSVCSPIDEQAAMRSLYLSVKDYRDPYGVLLSVPFLRLPTPQELPQYYEIIRKPVELLGIGQKLDQGKYANLDEFMSDMMLMFQNACDFNEFDSDIYKAACTLRRVLTDKKDNLLATKTTGPPQSVNLTDPPDVTACVRGLLIQIFTNLEKCYQTHFPQASSEVITPAPNLEKLLCDNPPLPTSSSIFSEIRENLNNCKYTRLEQLQLDVLKVLRNLRAQHANGSKEYLSVYEVARQFVIVRNQATEDGKRLSSPALSCTAVSLEEELAKDPKSEDTPSAIHFKDVLLDHVPSETSESSEESSEKLNFEQVVLGNGTVLRLGDFVYVTADAQGQMVVGLHRLWRTKGDNTIYFSGPIFRSTASLGKSLSHTIYNQEMIITDKLHTGSFLKNSIVTKCLVMDVNDYCLFRRTQYPEKDVYLCNSKFFVDRDSLHALKFGLKKFHRGPQTQEDEIFYFTEPLKIKKLVLIQKSVRPSHSSSSRSKRVEAPVVDLNGIPQEVLEQDKRPVLGQCIRRKPGRKKKELPVLKISKRGRKKKFRKPPSGYVLFAGEKRKQLTPLRPDSQFGDVSREIGSTWRNMSEGEREFYERRAKLIRYNMSESEKNQEERDSREQVNGSQASSQHTPSEVPTSVGLHDSQNGAANYAGFNKYGAPAAYPGMPPQDHPEHYMPGVIGDPMQMSQLPPTYPPLPTSTGYQYMPPGMAMPQHPMQTQSMCYPPPQAQPPAGYPQYPNQQMPVNMMYPPQAQMMNMMMRPRMNVASHVHPSMPPPSHPMQQQSQLRPPNQFSPKYNVISDTNGQSTTTVSGEQMQPNQQVTPSKPSVPLFVPVSPKPVKLLHSKVYSKHIETLRKNEEHLSDWDKQTAPANSAVKGQQGEHISSSFLSKECWRPQHNTVADALYALRDHLLRDALNIKTKLLGCPEAV